MLLFNMPMIYLNSTAVKVINETRVKMSKSTSAVWPEPEDIDISTAIVYLSNIQKTKT